MSGSQGRALGEARQVFLSHLIVMESAADCKRAILPSKFPVQDSLPSAFRSEKIKSNAAKSPTRQACGCPPGLHFFRIVEVAMNMGRALLTVLLLAPSAVANAAEPAGETQAESAAVSYYREIRPLLVQNCQGCHQPAKASGGYVMTSHAALLKKGD